MIVRMGDNQIRISRWGSDPDGMRVEQYLCACLHVHVVNEHYCIYMYM